MDRQPVKPPFAYYGGKMSLGPEISLGGADTFDNLQTLCRPCNSRKGARV